ncbi:ATP-binding protein [Streptomyces sp. NBC_01275]|uniref:ATP-binding protein n=1 Tax=Streptomyces sp. NBC_01275 TaxID=2903807 RepID=UPI00225480C7|nr:ATP-binding protein [Streptomyces sp. NBC_01275]MCX4761929.1 ATP-binding protein [Streptomyces sp. NBC_01275]
MPSPQSTARPAAHRRRRGRRPRTDRYLLDEVSGVLYAPLACMAVLAGGTVVAAWAFGFTVTQVAVCLGGSVLVTGLVGAIRVQAVAAALQGHRDGELQRVAEAVQAAEKSVIWTAQELCRGARPPLPQEPPFNGGDTLAKVLELVGSLQVQGAAAMLRVHDESQAAVLVAMHQTLSRRQHGLIGEMLEHLTLLQRATEDVDLLAHCFKIDHLATRLRRMVESVSVVLGGQFLRETRAPVPVATLLRGAKSEVVKYPRVQLASGDVGAAFALPAHVHPDVTHLLAEFIDNGLDHSDPAAKVIVRAQKVARGLHFEVEDRAILLMNPQKRDLLNKLLNNPGHADIADQVRRGSLGLITAARIAVKHGLEVWLSMNPTGGTTANVVVPNHYLVPTAPAIGTVTIPAQPQPRPGAGQLAHAAAAPRPTGPGPSAAGPARPVGDASTGSLPRRKRVQRPMPTEQGPAAPAPAANPQAVADWRTGLHAGLQSDASPTTQS